MPTGHTPRPLPVPPSAAPGQPNPQPQPPMMPPPGAVPAAHPATAQTLMSAPPPHPGPPAPQPHQGPRAGVPTAQLAPLAHGPSQFMASASKRKPKWHRWAIVAAVAILVIGGIIIGAFAIAAAVDNDGSPAAEAPAAASKLFPPVPTAAPVKVNGEKFGEWYSGSIEPWITQVEANLTAQRNALIKENAELRKKYDDLLKRVEALEKAKEAAEAP